MHPSFENPPYKWRKKPYLKKKAINQGTVYFYSTEKGLVARFYNQYGKQIVEKVIERAVKCIQCNNFLSTTQGRWICVSKDHEQENEQEEQKNSKKTVFICRSCWDK